MQLRLLSLFSGIGAFEKAFKMVKPKPRIDSVFRNSDCDLRQHKIKNLEDYAKSIGMKGYGFIWSY